MWLPLMCLYWDLACNAGMCPCWESDQRPFGSQVGTQSTAPHQPGLENTFIRTWLWSNPCPTFGYLGSHRRLQGSSGTEWWGKRRGASWETQQVPAHCHRLSNNPGPPPEVRTTRRVAQSAPRGLPWGLDHVAKPLSVCVVVLWGGASGTACISIGSQGCLHDGHAGPPVPAVGLLINCGFGGS